MIELLSDMPAGVTGIRVSGRLRGDDFRQLAPEFEAALGADEVRVVEVVAPDYEGFGPGGLVEDVKTGLGLVMRNHAAFKRFAFVTDKEWAIHAMHLFGWMVPGEFRLFRLDELEQAKEWAAG
ncbi:MAG: STAS/SEC14 domain-containing protein [Mycobacterium sp.]